MKALIYRRSDAHFITKKEVADHYGISGKTLQRYLARIGGLGATGYMPTQKTLSPKQFELVRGVLG